MTGKGGAAGDAAAPAAAALAAYGERFMAMFDDAGNSHATASTSQAQHQQRSAHGRPTKHGKPAKQQQQQQERGASEAAGLQQSLGNPGLQQQGQASIGQGTAAGNRRDRQSDEIDEILAPERLKRAKAAAGNSFEAGAEKRSAAAAVPVVDHSSSGLRGVQRSLHPGGISAKAARKLFMSHKASAVHKDMPAQGAIDTEQSPVSLDATLSAEEFRQLSLQVERLGGSALENKKQRKQWKAQYLERLGAKPEKQQQMGAKYGLVIAKNRAKREAKALQEAIASGDVRVKGMGKKKRALKDATCDRGLQEAGPGFKGGVLKVRNPDKVSGAREDLRLGAGRLPRTGGSRKGGKKTNGKGKRRGKK